MDLLESRYEVLLACFTQYAKIKTLTEIIPGDNYSNDKIQLETLLHILEDKNLRFYYLKKYEFEVKEKIKNAINAKEMETFFIEISNIQNEIKELCKIPKEYPFTLEQSLELFDFFASYFENCKK
jgi:hypothetical protein